jgi:hypothetical protein
MADSLSTAITKKLERENDLGNRAPMNAGKDQSAFTLRFQPLVMVMRTAATAAAAAGTHAASGRGRS